MQMIHEKTKIVSVESGANTGDEIITLSNGARYYKDPVFGAERISDSAELIEDVKIIKNYMENAKGVYVERKRRFKEDGFFVKRKHRY